jgi:hypothetical protein
VNFLRNIAFDSTCSRSTGRSFGFTETAIIVASAFGVAEHLVGRDKFLGAETGVGRIRIHVRVMLLGEKTISRTDVVNSAIVIQSERVIMIGSCGVQTRSVIS